MPEAGVTGLGVDAGDLDDSVQAGGAITEVFVSGGAGADWLFATGDSTAISGGAGDDRLSGLDGPDELTGWIGADQMRGGRGDDA